MMESSSPASSESLPSSLTQPRDDDVLQMVARGLELEYRSAVTSPAADKLMGRRSASLTTEMTCVTSEDSNDALDPDHCCRLSNLAILSAADKLMGRRSASLTTEMTCVTSEDSNDALDPDHCCRLSNLAILSAADKLMGRRSASLTTEMTCVTSEDSNDALDPDHCCRLSNLAILSAADKLMGRRSASLTTEMTCVTSEDSNDALDPDHCCRLSNLAILSAADKLMGRRSASLTTEMTCVTSEDSNDALDPDHCCRLSNLARKLRNAVDDVLRSPHNGFESSSTSAEQDSRTLVLRRIRKVLQDALVEQLGPGCLKELPLMLDRITALPKSERHKALPKIPNGELTLTNGHSDPWLNGSTRSDELDGLLKQLFSYFRQQTMERLVGVYVARFLSSHVLRNGRDLHLVARTVSSQGFSEG